MWVEKMAVEMVLKSVDEMAVHWAATWAGRKANISVVGWVDSWDGLKDGPSVD